MCVCVCVLLRVVTSREWRVTVLQGLQGKCIYRTPGIYVECVCVHRTYIVPCNNPLRCFLSAFRSLTCIDRCIRGRVVRRVSDIAWQWTVSAFGVPVWEI